MLSLEKLLSTFQAAIEQRQNAEQVLQQLQLPDPRQHALRRQLDESIQERDAELEALSEQFHARLKAWTEGCQQRLQMAEMLHRTQMQEMESRAARSKKQLEQQKSDSTWVVSSVLDDTSEDSPAREFERFKTMLLKSREDQVTEWEALNASINQAFSERGISGSIPEPIARTVNDREEAAALFSTATSQARTTLRQLQGLILPRLFRGIAALVVFLVLWILVTAPVLLAIDPQVFGVPGDRFQSSWLAISTATGAIGSLLGCIVLYSLASVRESEILRQVQDSRAEAHWAHLQWLRIAKDQLQNQQKLFEQQQRLIERDRQQSLQRYEQAHQRGMEEIEAEYTAARQAEEERSRAEHIGLMQEQQQETGRLEQEFTRSQEELQTRWAESIATIQSEYEMSVSEQQRQRQAAWNQLRTQWVESTRQFESAVQTAVQNDRTISPDWPQLSHQHWKPASSIPSAVRLGHYAIDLHQWSGAVPEDARLAPRVSTHDVPAQIPFPQSASVLFQAPGPAARRQALAAVQTLMLRLLTQLPPGKLRFTILDPVGLGESFGGFMHLTDYDELLVTSRIWTEAGQIESRLADLTEHMENILQKYLRNEFETIEEYNASAGEVAEPYHFLVISDFPAKFSEIAARRLVSIVNSGPRCGVYTLMICDPGKPLPNGFHFSDITGRMTRFEWREQAYYSLLPELKAWPLVIDAPPRPDEFTAIVKMVGDASKDARRVEVSFSRIAPKMDQIWTDDSRQEISVPLGRAGATKLQTMRLGKGTSQHMLIAGKTGSGKSTFLHILITNLALHYAPDQLNFFLIDFKKGVEFKDYATHQLPHAQVIAVESDREFGVSALQRLGEILQERGELFRREGVQDIAGYRNRTGQPMPRIVLVIDEFQEFFVEDDKISQNAALLLDRLVRQGRAFGIHVVLGSQTLGGAYSLARSTLGQVAVRVALQCSEADAHLILSEDNTAARLLTRPGEAIYNDANGMLEGNHPFQIAWITDEQRGQALDVLHTLQGQRQMPAPAMIVFEGNIPSDLTRLAPLRTLARDYSLRQVPVKMPTIWLGDAVEIAPPTALTFQRQSGNHLLLVGQDVEAAQGVMASAIVALAASLSPLQTDKSLFVLDGSHRDSPEAIVWQQISEALDPDVQIILPDETTLFLQAIWGELQRREAENQVDAPPLFLFVFHIARFRDLRKGEDDFGMGSFGMSSEPKPPEPSKMFADLLARGPHFGIHAMIWCDSCNNLDRWFSRNSLRELELRIAFQMNASDSSNLIDSPAASRLGSHRALLYREESGTFEKFRPYGLPSSEWLHGLRRQMLTAAAPVPAPDQKDPAAAFHSGGSQPERSPAEQSHPEASRSEPLPASQSPASAPAGTSGQASPVKPFPAAGTEGDDNETPTDLEDFTIL